MIYLPLYLFLFLCSGWKKIEFSLEINGVLFSFKFMNTATKQEAKILNTVTLDTEKSPFGYFIMGIRLCCGGTLLVLIQAAY